MLKERSFSDSKYKGGRGKINVSVGKEDRFKVEMKSKSTSKDELFDATWRWKELSDDETTELNLWTANHETESAVQDPVPHYAPEIRRNQSVRGAVGRNESFSVVQL